MRKNCLLNIFHAAQIGSFRLEVKHPDTHNRAAVRFTEPLFGTRLSAARSRFVKGRAVFRFAHDRAHARR